MKKTPCNVTYREVSLEFPLEPECSGAMITRQGIRGTITFGKCLDVSNLVVNDKTGGLPRLTAFSNYRCLMETVADETLLRLAGVGGLYYQIYFRAVDRSTQKPKWLLTLPVRLNKVLSRRQCGIAQEEKVHYFYAVRRYLKDMKPTE